MVSFGWDNNLGFTLGGGLAIEQTTSNMYSNGFYIKYDDSIFQKKGSNVSIGYFIWDAFIFTRYGLNRMNLVIGKHPGNFYGTEFTINLGLLYIRSGLMMSKDYPKEFPINFGSGLGL